MWCSVQKYQDSAPSVADMYLRHPFPSSPIYSNTSKELPSRSCAAFYNAGFAPCGAPPALGTMNYDHELASALTHSLIHPVLTTWLDVPRSAPSGSPSPSSPAR
jgi:hypothetical protein